MKTYADLLYELADFLQEEGRRLESGYGLSGLNETYRAKAEDIRQVLRTTPYADVLTTEQMYSITKKYDRSGTLFADIHELADSHEAMRRALHTTDSVAERYASGWSPGSRNNWYGPGGRIEPQTSDEVTWFESYAQESASG